MTVKINREPRKAFNLTPEDIVDGLAYEDEDGNIYVGNWSGAVAAFGLCGNRVISANDRTTALRAISIEVNVAA